MDEHALRVLEFDKVLNRLSRLTSFSGGRELALDLRPTTNYHDVLERQRLLAEAMRFRGSRVSLGLNDAVDVRQQLEKAALGGTLDAQELLNVASTQRATHQAKGAIIRAGGQLPLLTALAHQLGELHPLLTEISRSLDARGEVLDSASPALSVLRRDIKISHDRLHAKLQEFLASSAGRLAAQESIVTLRDGRYVVPIKADFRGEVRGIVHDVSSSGATVFVEPLAVVDLANQWRELQIEERREVERILRRLSGLVGADAETIADNVAVLAELDLVLAAARLAEELAPSNQDVLPSTEPGKDPSLWLSKAPSEIDLREARHPLLSAPVPISMHMAASDRVLLITGPNTGGKTVALKTVGLLALMAQSGLPVAADEGSRLPVFGEVLADIGDEQSIEQSLSTFSGHIKNVINLLERASATSLVLLDELAAGTDPAEGAALARALLLNLLERGSLTIATTHHGELKLFAHSQEGVINAAVEFDPVTLGPTYRITLGVPGRSNALAIAARLGLPQEILRVAQESLAPEQIAIDSLLDDLREEQVAAAEARKGEEQARRRAEQARAQIEQRLAGLDEERARRLDEAALALEQEVAAAREALQRAQRLADRQIAAAASLKAPEVEEAQEAITAAGDTARRLRRRSRRRRRGGIRPEQIKPGVEVWVQGIPMAAEALSAPDHRGELDVTFGGLRARVGIGQVVRVEERTKPIIATRVVLPQVPLAQTEIQVRGQTLDEALPLIEKFLDDGFRAGLSRLRVVHGKGTGKMRNAVRDLLRHHPLVKNYDFAPQPEGGEGVTVVEMALS
ncbi:MAG: endonuclease MutS2 [Dehalococcoidia bacterium]